MSNSCASDRFCRILHRESRVQSRGNFRLWTRGSYPLHGRAVPQIPAETASLFNRQNEVLEAQFRKIRAIVHDVDGD